MVAKLEAIQDKAKVPPKDVSKALGAPEFTKAQIVKSNKYMARCDALNALLKNDAKYTFAQVDAILKKFDEGGKN